MVRDWGVGWVRGERVCGPVCGGMQSPRCRAWGGSHQLSLGNLFFVRGNGMNGWTDFEIESIQEEVGHV